VTFILCVNSVGMTTPVNRISGIINISNRMLESYGGLKVPFGF